MDSGQEALEASQVPLDDTDQQTVMCSREITNEVGSSKKSVLTNKTMDDQKQLNTLERPQKNSTDVYKRMLMESWSADEEKSANRSSSKVSTHTLGNAGQAYEVVVRAKHEELPIVGYTPVFAQKASPWRGGETAKFKPGFTLEKSDVSEPPSIPTQEDSFVNPSSAMINTLMQDLQEQAYVTPFDKFVPQENQLPDLDPSVEAKLLAKSEVDPVRGVFEENLEKEIENFEALLNLPSFESYANRSDEIKKKMWENMQFWRNTSHHEKPKPPTDQELKLLDYATLCNMYTGTWGMDEDSMMLQFFYKFQYDDQWRERLKKGCFNMLDECNSASCGVCKEVADEDVAKMKPESFFEIEDKKDYEEVVMKLKEEFNRKYDEDTNWEFKQLIMNPIDSDLDSDSFVSDEELQICADEKPSSKDWIRAKGTWIAPKGFDVPPRDEEDLLPKDLNCEEVEILRYRNIVPQRPGDHEALEAATLDLMRAKFEKKKADERKGYFWRAKSNYVYRWPDFRKKLKKK